MATPHFEKEAINIPAHVRHMEYGSVIREEPPTPPDSSSETEYTKNIYEFERNAFLRSSGITDPRALTPLSSAGTQYDAAQQGIIARKNLGALAAKRQEASTAISDVNARLTTRNRKDFYHGINSRKKRWGLIGQRVIFSLTHRSPYLARMEQEKKQLDLQTQSARSDFAESEAMLLELRAKEAQRVEEDRRKEKDNLAMFDLWAASGPLERVLFYLGEQTEQVRVRTLIDTRLKVKRKEMKRQDFSRQEVANSLATEKDTLMQKARAMGFELQGKAGVSQKITSKNGHQAIAAAFFEGSYQQTEAEPGKPFIVVFPESEETEEYKTLQEQMQAYLEKKLKVPDAEELAIRLCRGLSHVNSRIAPGHWPSKPLNMEVEKDPNARFSYPMEPYRILYNYKIEPDKNIIIVARIEDRKTVYR